MTESCGAWVKFWRGGSIRGKTGLCEWVVGPGDEPTWAVVTIASLEQATEKHTFDPWHLRCHPTGLPTVLGWASRIVGFDFDEAMREAAAGD